MRSLITVAATSAFVACASDPASGPADARLVLDSASVDAAADAAPDDTCDSSGGADTASACTSGRLWSDGDLGSPSMRPGGPCIACHAASVGTPRFVVAGTVYRTLHEPNDCSGESGTRDRIQVRITDAVGRINVLSVNGSGNFFLAESDPFAMPLRAEIVAGETVRRMCGMQTSGDCNGCHTERGDKGAPGRIMLP